MKSMFSSLFWVNNLDKMISLFAIFASEDGKQLLSCSYIENNPEAYMTKSMIKGLQCIIHVGRFQTQSTIWKFRRILVTKNEMSVEFKMVTVLVAIPGPGMAFKI